MGNFRGQHFNSFAFTFKKMNEEEQVIFTPDESLRLQDEIKNLFSGQDENIFSILDKKSLNLSGQQIKILLFLKSFNNPFLDAFVKDYLDYKTYNRAYKVIIEALKYYSLIDLIRTKVRLNLSQQK